jgi:hypothetical protein
MIIQKPASDVRTLFSLAEKKAQRDSDGHLTIMRFTTHWKVFSGTPDLDAGNGREQIRDLSGHESLEEALLYFILN